MMWGFHVRSSANQRVTLYSEDRKLRDAWVDTIQMSVRARAANLYLDQRYVRVAHTRTHTDTQD